MTHVLSVSAASWINRWEQTLKMGGEIPEQLGNPPVDEPTVLGSCPKTLFILWDKWLNGVGRGKPAREFTCQERGLKQNKFKYYCNHLIVWKCMEQFISWDGNTVSVAVRQTERVYGTTCVCKLITRKMRPDERNGGHLQL